MSKMLKKDLHPFYSFKRLYRSRIRNYPTNSALFQKRQDVIYLEGLGYIKMSLKGHGETGMLVNEAK